ncbi:SOS response-associated peptidase [Geomicrobium sp. JSM 1781026]|uniref:SOS response-associated peptidase n=1 Tax=Geomicrobium sp. JSM 1781026 TaxID=3344580 RepID=UPI0035C238AC
MCGRFTFFEQLETLEKLFNIKYRQNTPLPTSYNIAPTQSIFCVYHGGTYEQLKTVRWGLIPSWAKEQKSSRPLINARAETVTEKPSFRQSFQRRRCIIPASGFYEWQTKNKKKQPFHIQLKNGDPLAFAGIWDTWSNDTEQMTSCAIITTEANELVADIHERMPVILSPADFDRWLDPTNTDPQSVTPMLEPYPAGDMIAYEVSPRVNDPRSNDAELVNSL